MNNDTFYTKKFFEKKLKKIILIGIVGILISSCDPGVTDLYKINNESDWEIFVRYKQWKTDTLS